MKSRNYHGWTIRPACSMHDGIFIAAVKVAEQGVTPDSPLRRFTFVGLENFPDTRGAERSAVQWARAWIDTHDTQPMLAVAALPSEPTKRQPPTNA